MEKEDDRGSDEINEMFCELCKKRDRSRTADGFCVDCVRYFCAECLANHNEFLPDHIYQDKKSMPQDVCLQQCPGHAEEIIKFYCSGCNNFFCSICKKKDHNTCKDVSHLPELVKQFEESKEFKEFKHEIESLAVEINNIESVKYIQKESVEAISKTAMLKIESARKQFIEWVDARVEGIQGIVRTIKDKDKKAVEVDCANLSALKAEVGGIKTNIEQIQKERRRCQLFMSMKDAQSRKRRFCDDLQRLKKHVIDEYDFEQFEIGDKESANVLQLGRLVFKLSQRLRQNPSIRLAEDEGKQIKRREELPVTCTEEQRSFIAYQMQRPLLRNDIWYVLDVKWFKQWKRYVKYEVWDRSAGNEAPPGPIDNTPIFQAGTEKLKKHLIDRLDYALVPEEGWRKLVSWYGMLNNQIMSEELYIAPEEERK